MGADDLLDKFRGFLDDAESVQPQETVFRERYRVVRHIGSGGMGSVYLVRDAVLGREAAMKVCDGQQVDSRLAEQFLVEAKLAAKLEHPNILPVYDMGVDRQKRYFFVMRYVEGQSLADALARGPLPEERRIEVFLQVCEAIRHAHSQGVLHRDIKPGNVLLSSAGHVFVIDWGISKLVSSATSGPVAIDKLQTLSSGLVGTPVYLPPEILTDDRAVVDARADVYALGILLYNMLGGAKPFEAHSRETLAEEKKKLRLNPLPADVPGKLVAVVRKAVAPRPQDRYASVDGLMEDVRLACRKNWLLRHPALLATGLTLLLAAGLFPLARLLMRETRARSVVVVATPPESRIAIRRDGRIVCEGSSPLRTAPLEYGRYRLEVRSPGYRAYEGDLDVAGGDDPLRLEIALLPSPGHLAVHPSDPEVTVRIEGEGEHPARPRPIDLPAGVYRVTLTRSGLLEKRPRTVTIESGRTSRILHDFSDPRLWSAGPETIQGGSLCSSPAFADIDGDGIREIVIPYIPPAPNDKSVRFSVIDSRTGIRREDLKASIPETVFHLFRAAHPDSPFPLYAWGMSGLYAIDLKSGPLAPVYRTDRYKDAIGLASSLLVAESQGLTVVDPRTGTARRVADWESAFWCYILLVDEGRRIVAFTQPLRGGARAAAFDAVDPGPELWTAAWKGVLSGNVVCADFDRDGTEDFAFPVKDDQGTRIVSIRGSDRSVIWTHPSEPAAGTLLHVRSAREDSIFAASSSVVLKLSARDGTRAWRREFRIEPAQGEAGFVVAPLDADDDGIIDLAYAEIHEKHLRIFSGADGGVTLRRPVRHEYGLYTADLDGNGRDDLLLCGPKGLEAFAPGGSGVAILEPQPPDDSTSVTGNPVSEGETLVRCGDRLLRVRLSDGEVLEEVALPVGRRALEFLPAFVLIRSEGEFVVRPRRRLETSIRISSDAKPMEWDDANGDGLPECLVLSTGTVRLLSGRDGTELWSRSELPADLKIDARSLRDIDGDGIRDFPFGVEAGVRIRFFSGKTGATAEAGFPDGTLGFLWQRRVERMCLVWWTKTHVFRRDGDVSSFARGRPYRLVAIPDLTADGTEELLAEDPDRIRVLDGENPDREMWAAAARTGECAGTRMILEGSSGGRLILSSHEGRTGAREWTADAGPQFRVRWAIDSRTGRIGVARPGAYFILDPDRGIRMQEGPLRGEPEWISFDPGSGHLYVGAERCVYRIARANRSPGAGPVWEGLSAPDRRGSWRKE